MDKIVKIAEKEATVRIYQSLDDMTFTNSETDPSIIINSSTVIDGRRVPNEPIEIRLMDLPEDVVIPVLNPYTKQVVGESTPAQMQALIYSILDWAQDLPAIEHEEPPE